MAKFTKTQSQPQASQEHHDFTIQLYPCFHRFYIINARMFYSSHINLIFQMKNILLVASLLATIAFADLDLANNLRGTDNVVISGRDNSGQGNGNSFRGDRNHVNGDKNRFVGDRNDVEGDDNDIEGDQNQLKGDGNKVFGAGNFVSGSGNFVIGAGNQVNTMSEAEQRRVAEEMAARIRERLQAQMQMRFTF